MVLYSLFGLFFVLGAGVVLYAQGYRLDLDLFAVQKVGAIYVRTYPKNASVTVDGKNVDRGAMLLNSGTLVPDLFPKTHELVAEAPGYVRWTRQVVVNPALVTEVQPILLPEKPELIRERAPIDFWALPDAPLIEFLPGLTYSGYKIPGYFAGLNAARNQILTRDAAKNYFLTNVSSPSAIAPKKLSGLLGGKITFDTEPDKFISYTTAKVAALTTGENPLVIFTAPVKQTVSAAASSKNLIGWITKDNQNISWLWLYEKLSGNSRKIGSIPGTTQELKFSPVGEIAIFQTSGELYRYDPSSGEIFKIASGVKSFEYSPGGLLAILSDKALEISGGPEYSRLNLAFFPDIKNIFWYADEGHLFLQFSDHLGLLDLNDLIPENIQAINGTAENSYDITSNSLYFVKGSSLYRITFPS